MISKNRGGDNSTEFAPENAQRRGLGTFAHVELVADSAHGLDVPLGFAELLPKAGQMIIDDTLGDRVTVFSDIVEDSRPGKNLVGLAREKGENLEFRLGQGDLPAAPPPSPGAPPG